MSIKIESEQLSELANRRSELRQLSKRDTKIATGLVVESIGSFLLLALNKGDPQLLTIAAGVAWVAGSVATMTAIKRESNIMMVRNEAQDIKLSEQTNQLAQIVRDLPQETFSGIWNNLQQIRKEATLEPDEFGGRKTPTFDIIFQAFAERAGESQEQLD